MGTNSYQQTTLTSLLWAASLASLVIFLFASMSPAQQPGADFTLNFEGGNLQGWAKKGTAFDCQPTQGDNPRARHRESANQEGLYWIGTYECYKGRLGQQPGSVQGDGPQGSLTSASFTIPRRSLIFLVGGGSSHETRVELRVSDPIEGVEASVLTASGENTETMRRVTWDLTPYAGRSGRLVIVDESSGPWGHINVDDFRFVSPAAAASVFVRPPAVTEPVRRRVPNLGGRTVEQAKSLLEPDLELGEVEYQLSRSQPDTIVSQRPGADETVMQGTAVDVVVARGVVVPNVQGLDPTEAQGRLEPYLQLGGVRRETSTYPIGKIFAQDPRANSTAPLGTRVNVIVAQGVRVPDLSELSPPDARTRLRQVGLELGGVRTEPSTRPVGTIIRQDPEPGTEIPVRSNVQVVVAQGVGVPLLVGRALDEAERILSSAGLQRGQVSRELSELPVGKVFRQDPPANTTVPLQTPVHLTVARGVTVPDIRGIDVEEGKRQLQVSRLQAGEEESELSPKPVGTVLRQDPSPGTEVPVGTQVRYAIAQGVPVPDLNSLDREQAENHLQQDGLRLGDIEMKLSNQAVGTVIRQAPAAASTVPLNSPVNITIAQGVAVPDLHGQDIGQANRQLSQQGLRLGSTEEELSVSPVGTVVHQDPTAGTVVPLQTPIRLVLAQGVEVPRLIGSTQQEGEKLLADGKLVLGDVALQRSTEDPGTILGQDPPPGRTVPWKSPVRIVVAQGITVPRLVDLGLDEARQRLRDAQLVPGKIEEIPSYKDWPGTVLGQEPRPGVQVALESQVSLTVARIHYGALVMAIGLLGGLGWLTYFLLHKPPSPVPGLPPNINVRLGRDFGRQRVEAPVGDLTGLDVRLRGVCPEGTHAIKCRGPLVKED